MEKAEVQVGDGIDGIGGRSAHGILVEVASAVDELDASALRGAR